MDRTFSTPDLAEIPPILLAWYRRNARCLPWRKNISPYRTWISEIMLQQTRVETVIPYYERFLAALPDISALAEAPEGQLLKLWEGLGYYSRARNLQKAARMIMEKHNGSFPSEYAQILALPGIGEYTAGAIASIAFGKPFPAVDGNVLRVLSRLTGCSCDIAEICTRRMAQEALAKIYPAEDCSDFTQSLMELGATVCLPNTLPHCTDCPLAHLCTALKENKVMQLPVKSAAKARRIEKKTVFIIRCGNRIALRRRPAKGLLAGLLEFPSCAGECTQTQAAEYLKAETFEIRHLDSGIAAKHIFTHLEWHMTGFYAESLNAPGHFIWMTPEEMQQNAIPSAFEAFRRICFTGISQADVFPEQA